MTAIVLLFLVPQQSYSCQGHLPVEASRSHSDTTHSVGLLWTSDRLVAETFPCPKHNIHNRHTSMLSVRFEPAIPASKWPHTYILESAWPPRVAIVLLLSSKLYYISNNVVSTTKSVTCIHSVYRLTWLYSTGCFTTLGHNCRRWFPRSLWWKKFV